MRIATLRKKLATHDDEPNKTSELELALALLSEPRARRRDERSTQVTYRIHHSVQPGANVFVLSGVLDTEHAARLQELLATAAAGRIVLDLKDITLVDRTAVRFLASVESAGTEIVNCPEYVRSWIAAESESR